MSSMLETAGGGAALRPSTPGRAIARHPPLLSSLLGRSKMFQRAKHSRLYSSSCLMNAAPSLILLPHVKAAAVWRQGVTQPGQGFKPPFLPVMVFLTLTNLTSSHIQEDVDLHCCAMVECGCLAKERRKKERQKERKNERKTERKKE